MKNVSLLCLLVLLLAPLCCTGCNSGNTAFLTSYSSIPVTVKTPSSSFNRMTVTVHVCIPNTTTCEDIDNVMIDTGSVGLRLQESALPADLQSLPVEHFSQSTALGECLPFGSGSAWGLIHLADITIGHAHADSMPVQIVNPHSHLLPANCVPGTATSNGTLGIGIESDDCTRNDCAMPLAHGPQGGQFWQFYACTPQSCKALSEKIPTQYHLPNPLTLLDGGYNGAVIDLPEVPDGQADQIEGTLTFGVNLNTDNLMPGAQVVPLNERGRFTTTYNGIDAADSYIDAGSPAYVVPTDEFATCKHPLPTYAFCVDPAVTRTATMMGIDGASHTVEFQVGTYPSSGVSIVAAYGSDPSQPSFVWGAPFFFGKRVAVVRMGQPLPGTNFTGPLYAFESTTIR